MLEELDVKNFALIDSAHVEFNRGFTVLSGETGAGKSILIGSVDFLLGGKASVDQIRKDCHEASVSGLFYLENSDAFKWLEEHGIESEENRVLIRRVVKDTGKSSCWLSGVPVTRADLSEFSAYLIDIHGQHEQQSLMKVSEHRRYLDIYGALTDEVNEFTNYFNQLVEKRKQYELLTANENERKNRIEMLQFAVSEIESAKLKPGEDTELENEESKLSSYEKLYSDVNEINSALDSSNEGSVLSTLKKVLQLASHSSGIDASLSKMEERLQNSFYELDDISRDLKHYEASLVFDPEKLQQVQERLDLIYKLKKKYCQSVNAGIDELLKYLENAQNELETIVHSDENKEALVNQIKELEKIVYTRAKALSEKRKLVSQKMSSEIESILFKLGMKETKFLVKITEKEGNSLIQRCGPYGMDDIEFFICPNPGAVLLPLVKIASGGELSRVMLALKTILSAAYTMVTLVFDEIDTGIVGEVAISLGEHMKALAQKKQILCITHLASIAVFADNQIKIEKGVEDNSTSTKVFGIEGNERVREIARMLSGDSNSPESLEHACSMLKTYGGC